MRKNVKIIKRLFALCFLLCVAAAAWLYRAEYQESRKEEALSKIHDEETSISEGGISGAVQSLSEINADYFGWLTVDGTQIDLPVVLGEDNDYYLDHDFYGEESRSGTLFADCLTKQDEDGNLLIYGHHMKNGTMFGGLKSFYQEDFFREHRLARLELEEQTRYYEIFAVLIIPGEEAQEDYLPIRTYVGPQELSRQEEILSALKERAIFWRNLPFSQDSPLLFLVTCDYTRENGRLLLCCQYVESE
jgi:sortase B